MPTDRLGDLLLAERLLPSSKSQSNRALILAASSNDRQQLRNLSTADDTVVLRLALEKLGCHFQEDSAGDWSVSPSLGQGPMTCPEALFLGSAGSSFRFLLAWLASRESWVQIDCTEQLRRRPMQPLLTVLRQWGAGIQALGLGEQPPYTVQGNTLSGGEILADSQISSQFLSALLLSAPFYAQGLRVRFDASRQVSMSYIWQTLAVMEQFAIQVLLKDWKGNDIDLRELMGLPERANRLDVLYIPRQTISGSHQVIVEPDAASASYVAAAALFAKRRVYLPGLQLDSTQPEMEFFRILRAIDPALVLELAQGGLWIDGRVKLKAFDVDMGQAPDTAMTLGVLACSIEGPCTIRGIAHNRLKESNRLEGFVGALQSLGIAAQAFADGFWIEGQATVSRAKQSGPTLDCAADHRMVMSLSLLAMRGLRFQLTDIDCVAKSFPNYFSVLEPFGLHCG